MSWRRRSAHEGGGEPAGGRGVTPGVPLEWALPGASAPVKGRGARAGAGRAGKLGRRGSEVALRAPWVRARLSLVR